MLVFSSYVIVDKFRSVPVFLLWSLLAAYTAVPLALLASMLRARLARSSIGELVVRLRAHPAPADLNSELDIGVEPDRAKNAAQLRLCDDAGAAAGELALDPFEHVDVPAGAPQQQRGEEAAHGAADDQRAPLGCLVQLPRSRHFHPDKVVIYRAKPGGMPWV